MLSNASDINAAGRFAAVARNQGDDAEAERHFAWFKNATGSLSGDDAVLGMELFVEAYRAARADLPLPMRHSAAFIEVGELARTSAGVFEASVYRLDVMGLHEERAKFVSDWLSHALLDTEANGSASMYGIWTGMRARVRVEEGALHVEVPDRENPNSLEMDFLVATRSRHGARIYLEWTRSTGLADLGGQAWAQSPSLANLNGLAAPWSLVKRTMKKADSDAVMRLSKFHHEVAAAWVRLALQKKKAGV